MTTEQLLFVVGAIVIGVSSLTGAALGWRALGKAGAGLRYTDGSLADSPASVERQVAQARIVISDGDASARRATWALAQFDQRADVASAKMRASRTASDSLRARLVDGQINVARLRAAVRLLTRLNDFRREFWA